MFWVDLTFEWYGDAMIFCVFKFFFRSNVGKGYLDESDFFHCLGNFSKVPYWKFLDHNFVNVSPEQLQGTLTTAFWNAPYSSGFYGHGSRYVLIPSSRLLQTSWNENQRKCLENYHSQKKCNPALQRTLYQNRWLFFSIKMIYTFY